jgi:hypothetical protein
MLEELALKSAGIVGDKVVGGGGKRLLVVERRIDQLHVVIVGLHQISPAESLVVGGVEQVADVNAGAVGDEGIFETGGSDEGANFVGSDLLEAHIGGGVVAVHDHGFKAGTLGDLAGEMGWIEDGDGEVPDAGVKREIAFGDGLNDVGRIGLAQGFAEDEGFDGTADDEGFGGVGGGSEELRPAVDRRRVNLDGCFAGPGFEGSEDFVGGEGRCFGCRGGQRDGRRTYGGCRFCEEFPPGV